MTTVRRHRQRGAWLSWSMGMGPSVIVPERQERAGTGEFILAACSFFPRCDDDLKAELMAAKGGLILARRSSLKHIAQTC